MHAFDAFATTDRLQLGAAVHHRSWEWLIALRKRLNVDLQLVDDAQVPLLTVTERTGTAGASLLSDAPGVKLAVANAVRTRTPQAASVDRFQAVIVPVTLDRVVAGALVVARRAAEDQPIDQSRSQLELVGFWLTSAIEAHLQSPPSGHGDLDRLSALCRLLADASAQGSDRNLAATFVETLAIWHDFEAYGYVESAREEYVRDVVLPGADPARTPAIIARAALPEFDEVNRLAKSDAERLGFATGDDVVLARIGEGTGSWLLAITGSIEPEDLQRLGLYISLVEQAVARATEAATAHLLSTLSAPLLADSDNAEERARHALQQLQTALGMSDAAFTVTSRTGAPLLHVGAAFTAKDLAAGSDDGRIVIIRRDPQQYAMAFVGVWSSAHRVTRQEHHVAHAAADLLEAWVRRLVRRSQRGVERRSTQRGFDEVLERVARDAVQGGIPVTAVVISFSDTVVRPDVTQTRVVRLREHLRGGDLVGRLGEGDVGMLLQDTVAAQADALVARMRRVLEADGVRAAHMAIGMATLSPGEPMTGALAHEARQRARYPE